MHLSRLLFAVALATSCFSIPVGPGVGNFGISSGLGSDNTLFSSVSVNPPVWDQYLATVGSCVVTITTSEGSYSTSQLNASALSEFPSIVVTTSDPRLMGATVSLAAFAPISPTDSSLGFLPLLMLAVNVTGNNAGLVSSVSLAFTCSNAAFCGGAPGVPTHTGPSDPAAVYSGDMFLGGFGVPATASLTSVGGNAVLTAMLTLTHAGKGFLVLGHYSNTGYYALAVASAQALFGYAVDTVVRLQLEHAAFAASLPTTGDATTDRYVRAYVAAAVLLTKGINTLEVITMGYVEFNQRDSFWTSWLHHYLWPDLDVRMIEESVLHQLPDGKIPTTILPNIIRPDNVDITCYFLMRVHRYVTWHNDTLLLAVWYPHLKRAAAYLTSRDVGDGVPAALNSTFWADWKDVPQVQGRKYAPHFVLLYVAAMRAMAEFAMMLFQTDDALMFLDLYARAAAFVNTPVAQRGMWAGDHYVDHWWDNRPVTWVLQDQSVGIFFGVVPPERAMSIFSVLMNNGSENAYGVRETFPYISWFGGPGIYHNGGIWPWLTCVDATNRLRAGLVQSGTNLFNKLGRTMMQANNNSQFVAWEYMDGTTGVDMGNSPQGWDAACLLVAWHGMWGLERASANGYCITVRVPCNQDVTTRLPLAKGHGWLSLARSGGRTEARLEGAAAAVHIAVRHVCGATCGATETLLALEPGRERVFAMNPAC